MPFQNLIQYRICDPRYQGRRNVCVIHLLEGGDDIPSTHALGIQRQNLVIELGQAGLALAYQLRFKGARAIPRRIDLNLAMITLQRLAAVAVTAIAAATPLGIMLVVTQVLVYLGTQGGLYSHLL